MSLENTLERIANNLGRIADTLDKVTSADPVPLTADTPVVVDEVKEKPKAASKPKQDKKPNVVQISEAPAAPTNEAELIALVTESTKGLAPEKMIELGRILREDFKVAKLPDLPEDDYANFSEALRNLVQS